LLKSAGFIYLLRVGITGESQTLELVHFANAFQVRSTQHFHCGRFGISTAAGGCRFKLPTA
jgi:hypothetical protein